MWQLPLAFVFFAASLADKETLPVYSPVDAAVEKEILLVTFDGAEGTTFSFVELNDPVMGGVSSGTWAVNSDSKYGVFDGEVADVPKLKAPGFIKAAADGAFADASSAAGGYLQLEVRSSTPYYQGFRVSFASGTLSPSYSCAGGGSLPLSRGCFKAHFVVPAGDDFTKVLVPLASFSDRWSPATGEPTASCQQDATACVTSTKLAAIKRLELWAEGKNGKAHLELRSISIVSGVSGMQSARPPASQDSCAAAVQSILRFNISARTDPEVPVPVDAGENLAEAVCCDKRTLLYAEPQFLFDAPDIALFSRLDQSGITIFYDSVCGVPLFKAPVNRSFADFEADTREHGWPSFRPAEVVNEHVLTDTVTGAVTSSCGTHLGSYLPDGRGPRWCMDLSCISGSPLIDASFQVQI